jgi:hypothetical protein
MLSNSKSMSVSSSSDKPQSRIVLKSESEQVIDRLTSLNYRPQLKCRDCEFRTTSYDKWTFHKMKYNHRIELRSRYDRSTP